MYMRNGAEEEDTNGYHVSMLLPKATIRRCMYYIVADATMTLWYPHGDFAVLSFMLYALN